MKSNRTIIDGIAVLDEAGLIPFKAKAHLDLAARKERGERVDSKDVRKHKNDVFRLVQILDPMRKVDLPDAIRIDMAEFCQKVLREGAPMKQLSIRATVEESVNMIKSVYGLD